MHNIARYVFDRVLKSSFFARLQQEQTRFLRFSLSGAKILCVGKSSEHVFHPSTLKKTSFIHFTEIRSKTSFEYRICSESQSLSLTGKISKKAFFSHECAFRRHSTMNREIMFPGRIPVITLALA